MTPPTSGADPTPPPSLPNPDDGIAQGVLYAMGWQVASIIITIPVFFTVWGLVQWVALVPHYLRLRNRNYPLAAKAMLITGFIGMLLNGACAALFFGH